MRGDSEQPITRGPLGHRLFILLLGGLLTILLLWLLGFAVRDIGRMPGPDFEEITSRHVDQGLLDQLASKQREGEAIGRQIAAQREVQAILQTSLANSGATMDQLMGLHRLNLERGVTPSEAEQTALAESESLFLENQRRFQEANEQIANLSEQQRRLGDEIRSLNEQIAAQGVPAQQEYEAAMTRHNFKVASLKLAVLVPLLLIAAWAVIGHRRSAYLPILWAALIAVFWRMALVMHQHFPREFFKYIAIGTSIVIVLAFMISLIRMLTSPRRGWLLRQHREAYKHHRCPVCAYPIPGGPRAKERPLSCPSCGVRLFEPCEQCGAVRHSLLPHCSSCGAEKAVLASSAASSA